MKNSDGSDNNQDLEDDQKHDLLITYSCDSTFTVLQKTDPTVLSNLPIEEKILIEDVDPETCEPTMQVKKKEEVPIKQLKDSDEKEGSKESS